MTRARTDRTRNHAWERTKRHQEYEDVSPTYGRVARCTLCGMRATKELRFAKRHLPSLPLLKLPRASVAIYKVRGLDDKGWWYSYLMPACPGRRRK